MLKVTTACLISGMGVQAAVADEEIILLDAIQVDDAEATGTDISGGKEGPGATLIDANGIAVRDDGSGDANSVLTTLPGVQYATKGSTDAGQNVDDVLNLQPLELSISGGATGENNFMLNGVGINSVSGNSSPYATDPLSREDGSPSLYGFYGLSSQTQYVPSAMLESVEVIDNNVSARYGGFQGGVVNYSLKAPNPEKAEGSVTVNYGTSDWTSYKLGTESGENPDDQPKPQWTKLEYALDVNQPLNDHSALRFGFSRRQAQGQKAKLPQYVEEWAEDESTSDFYALSYVNEFIPNHTFTLTGTFTDYNQEWTSNYVDDYDMTVQNQAFMLDAKYERDWGLLSVGGLELSNVKFTLNAIYQNNKASNLTDSDNTMSYWYASRSDGYYTNAFDDWCLPDTGVNDDGETVGLSNVACRTGSLGDKAYYDRRKRLQLGLTGDVWAGSFALGAAVEQIDAGRSSEGFIYNSSATRLSSDAGYSSYTCPTNSTDCLATQFFKIRIVQDPYDVQVQTLKTEAYAELEQTFGDFTLRGGLRMDHNDVLDNVDIAPRLTAKWQPAPNFQLTLGANRYYSDDYAAYAIHDAMPRGETQTRSVDENGVVGEWVTSRDLGSYSFSQSGLRTPYTDEYTIGMLYNDGWTGGTWRLTGLYRDGKDQFANSDDSSSVDATLTNDGWSTFKSATLEYEKAWQMEAGSVLDMVGLYASAVWADRATSNDTYFYSDDGSIDDYIFYNGQSYTQSEFQAVTGNLDIPVRATVELRSTWKNQKYGLGLGADVAFGYDGVRDTGDTETHDTSDGGRASHSVYEDYRFATTVAATLSAWMQVAETRQGNMMLNMKVYNLFNSTGSETATDDNPWIAGRTFYVGANLTW